MPHVGVEGLRARDREHDGAQRHEGHAGMVGGGRVPAMEILVSTARVRECIADKDRTKELHDAIAKGYTTYGMQTFDQSLMHLVKQGLVTYEEALKHVSNPDDFALRFRGIASTSDGQWDDFEKDREGAKEEPLTEKPGVDEPEADFNRFSILSFPFHLIFTLKTNTYELYDVSDDPMERSDQYREREKEPKIDQLKQKVNDYARKALANRSVQKKDEKTVEMLKALGYIK